jgi:hypothetical protein
MAALNCASGDASPAWALRAAFSAAESPAALIAASAASTAAADGLLGDRGSVRHENRSLVGRSKRLSQLQRGDRGPG